MLLLLPFHLSHVIFNLKLMCAYTVMLSSNLFIFFIWITNCPVSCILKFILLPPICNATCVHKISTHARTQTHTHPSFLTLSLLQLLIRLTQEQYHAALITIIQVIIGICKSQPTKLVLIQKNLSFPAICNSI